MHRGRSRVVSACGAASALLAVLLAGVAPAAGQHDARQFTRAATASVCRVPRLKGLVVAVARERAAKAGCRVRLEGARLTAAHVQTIRRQAPGRGQHGRVVTIWVNPLCGGSAAAGPGIEEPLITVGPTELLSGLYVVGGPFRQWSEPHCTYRPGEPGAGTITVREPAGGAIVASQTVTAGHLATIPLAPGTYTLEGTFGEATINSQAGKSFPTTVQIPPGKIVRQDVFLDVP